MSCSDSEESKRNRALNRQLAKLYEEESKEIKLLLLGAGGSGKSTIFKQMKIIHASGFDDAERNEFKHSIYKNVLDIFVTLVAATETWNIELDEENKQFAASLKNQGDGNFILVEKMGDNLENLWKDKAIQTCFGRRNELEILESAKFFAAKVKKLCAPDYVPSVEDVLYCRTKTVGIVQERFKGNGREKRNLLFVDVGGQRNERRKWIHAFDAVTCVIFLVSIAGYNQVLEEDGKTNRLKEALTLFHDICNDRFFKNKSVIIFYNKEDLFREKIKKIDLNVCFKQYTGGKNYKNATEYIMKRFNKKNANPKRQIYGHLTTATNTKNIEHVFNDCQAIILKELLSEEGLLG